MGCSAVAIVSFVLVAWADILVANTPTCTESPLNTIEIDGQTFRDLDHDGILSAYEDWRLTPEERAKDLVARLTINEKIGLMLHGTLAATGGPMGVIGIGPEYDLESAEDFVVNRGVNCMISRIGLEPAAIAEQNNAIQKIAAKTRLGIPVTVSTDPRHHRSATVGASVDGNGYTLWPGPLGLAATGDAGLVRDFADIVRTEYRATGMHVALSPQADLATSPRWSRNNGTFGENPQLVQKLVGAYVEGIQGGKTGLNETSVAAVVKHWVGYGAAPEGYDGHNYYGRYSTFPAGAFNHHIAAFLDAFAHGVAGVMPTYNILQGLTLNGQPVEQIGAGYSEQLLTDLLRGEHEFEGIILSDWAIAKDVNESCRTGNPPQMPPDISMAWGVEELTRAERFAKAVLAGMDQFGGEDDPAPLKSAMESGLVTEERLAQSAYRVLLQKFELGLFDNPFVDVAEVEKRVGTAESKALAKQADAHSTVVLEKPATLSEGSAVYLNGIDKAPFVARGFTVVENYSNADVAIVKFNTPYETLHPEFFFGRMQHEGDLDFKEDGEDFKRLQEISNQVPTIVAVEMDRPAILTNIKPLAAGLIATFGLADESLAELLIGNDNTSSAYGTGHLPFALPKTMENVRTQSTDQPLDDSDPLYPMGFGLRE